MFFVWKFSDYHHSLVKVFHKLFLPVEHGTVWRENLHKIEEYSVFPQLPAFSLFKSNQGSSGYKGCRKMPVS
jgi:hypothetical protein